MAEFMLDFVFRHDDSFASAVRITAELQAEMIEGEVDLTDDKQVFTWLATYHKGLLLRQAMVLMDEWIMESAERFNQQGEEEEEESEPAEEEEEEEGEPEPYPDGDDEEEGEDGEPGEDDGDGDEGGQEPGADLEEAKRVLAEYLMQQAQAAQEAEGDGDGAELGDGDGGGAGSPEEGDGQEAGDGDALEGVVLEPAAAGGDPGAAWAAAIQIPPIPTGPAPSGAAIFANFEGDEFTN